MTQLVLLDRATTLDTLPVTGQHIAVPYRLENQRISIQASIASSNPTAVVAATVSIDVSNDGRQFKKDVIVFQLNGTGEDTDIESMDVPYEQMRVRVTALSGTGAKVTVTARV
jgi:hypothetical protein